jgi:hypothetical protein
MREHHDEHTHGTDHLKSGPECPSFHQRGTEYPNRTDTGTNAIAAF